MDLSQQADLPAILQQLRAAPRMESRMILNRTDIPAPNMEPFQQQLDHPFQGIEIASAAIEPDRHLRVLIRQFLPLVRDIFIPDLIAIENGVFMRIVVGKHFQHRRQGGGTHYAGILPQRVGNLHALAKRGIFGKADLVVKLRADEGIGHDLVAASRLKGTVDLPLELLLRCEGGFRGSPDHRSRDLVIAVEAGDFLCNIGFMLHIGTEGGHDHFIPLQLEFQAEQDLFHLLAGDFNPQETVNPIRVEGDPGGLRRGMIHINHAIDYLAHAEELDQLAGPQDGAHGILGVQPFLIPGGSIGTHPEVPGGDPDRAA